MGLKKKTISHTMTIIYLYIIVCFLFDIPNLDP